MLVGKSQTLELHPMDVGYAFFAKRFFRTPQECATITESWWSKEFSCCAHNGTACWDNEKSS